MTVETLKPYSAAITLMVTKGLYSVLLGDTALANMSAIPAGVFLNPDVHLRVWFDDGSYVEAAYFTSESDARTGEKADDFAGPQQEYVELFGDMSFIDLRDPLLD